MTDSDLDARLRDVQLQLATLTQLVSTNVDYLRRVVDRHDEAIFGRAGDDRAVGIDKRTDRLEQRDVIRRWTLRAAFAAGMTALAEAAWQHLPK